ncbi:MAG TPA: FtsX-like permease family protein [Bacteroidales bacterium]|nr:FtsX-like permease family protein [Bacteroidales bacterium]
MIISISWRNIWRNKVRSLVIIAAITIGIFAGVFTWAFYRGMVNQRVQTAIATESSHIQIHAEKYRENPDQKFFIKNIDSIAAIILETEGVKAVSGRIMVNAMITSAETGAGVKINAIDPEMEKQVTNTHTKLTAGDYFAGDKKTPLLIGEKLAEKLSVKLRSRVVLTFQAMDGTLTTGLFRVGGIYKTANSMIDETNVFMKSSDAVKLIGISPDAGHELAVMLMDNDAERLNLVTGRLKAAFPGLDVAAWREIMPEVSIVEESMDLMMYVFMGVILAALIFGIINTMLMAVLERVKELGMLMAVGMNKSRVFRMIMLETVFLTFTGGVFGVGAGYLISLVFYHKGIDLSRWADAYEKLGYDTIVYPVIEFDIAWQVAIMVLVTGVLAAVYPAMKAIRLKPADSLRIDM